MEEEAAGIKVDPRYKSTCFTSIKVQILTPAEQVGDWCLVTGGRREEVMWGGCWGSWCKSNCFASTQVQILTPEVQVGDAGGRRGEVMYVGRVSELPSGVWIGVRYDAPVGKNDGSVKGVSYFECLDKYGGFVRPDALRKTSQHPRKHVSS